MDTLQRMRADWEQRAHEDPLHYIALNQRDLQDFESSGREDVARILDGVPAGGVALEIGAGIGRLLVAMQDRFDELVGVDISEEMVRLSRSYLADHPAVSVRLCDGETLPLPAESFDFAFSYITFQHIPARAIVERYMAEAHRVLRPGGRFRFQVHRRTPRQAVLRPLRIERPSTWKGYNWTKLSLERSLRATPFPRFTVWRDGPFLWADCWR